MEQEIDANELLEAQKNTIANLIQENLTLKILLGKIASGGNKPQE